MGLEPLPLEDWLSPRTGDDVQRAERRAILEKHEADVIAVLPEGTGAVEELSDLLRNRGHDLPDMATPSETLLAIAENVVEDICLLSEQDGQYHLSAGILCFPNRWSLRKKLGGTITAAHEPVPEYAEKISGTVDRFLLKLRPMRAFVRSNWGLSTIPDLYLPEPATPVIMASDEAFYLRREEQSFLKLPRTGGIAFSIRTIVTPWAQVPEATKQFVNAAATSLSADWLTYKAIKTN